jgi:hypothetical protein
LADREENEELKNYWIEKRALLHSIMNNYQPEDIKQKFISAALGL